MLRPSNRVRRRAGALLVAGALTATLGAPTIGTAPAAAGADTYPPTPTYVYPTNAAKIFRWGVETWRDEFEVDPLREDWRVSKGDTVVTRNGMITLMAFPRSGNVTAKPRTNKAAYGRWEARVRVWEKDRFAGTPYTAFWELAPARRKERHCGAQNIVMAAYRQDDTAATGAVRTLPDLEFAFTKDLPLTQGWFHTFAIEVTPDHISWFVDREVVHTERRPEALSGVTFRPQFRLQAVPGAEMRPTWMQMDWVRYYDLSRPNAQSIEAPEMTQGTYADAC
jgi:hypothetical protein